MGELDIGPPHEIVGLKVKKINQRKKYRRNTNFDYLGSLKLMDPFGFTKRDVDPPPPENSRVNV